MLAKWSAITRPMPREEPVTQAILPVNLFSLVLMSIYSPLN
jgi:hypothetical protein